MIFTFIIIKDSSVEV